MSGIPYRKDSYSKLGDHMFKLQAAIDAEIAALERVVKILLEFQQRPEAK